MTSRDDSAGEKRPESVPGYLKDPVAFIQRCRDEAARRDREGVPLTVIHHLEAELSLKQEQGVILPSNPAPLAEVASSRNAKRTIDRWHWQTQMQAKAVPQPSSKEDDYEVIAPYRSPAEDAIAVGTRTVELRRSSNHIWTLWVQLTGADAKGRLLRFTIKAPKGSWKSVCFIGTDENGIGALWLTRFNPQLRWELVRGCTFVLESLVPQDLQANDRDVLEKSRGAAKIGRDALDTILAAMPKSTSAE
jgi:hypothetical protein